MLPSIHFVPIHEDSSCITTTTGYRSQVPGLRMSIRLAQATIKLMVVNPQNAPSMSNRTEHAMLFPQHTHTHSWSPADGEALCQPNLLINRTSNTTPVKTVKRNCLSKLHPLFQNIYLMSFCKTQKQQSRL